jgi:hypothetical protein
MDSCSRQEGDPDGFGKRIALRRQELNKECCVVLAIGQGAVHQRRNAVGLSTNPSCFTRLQVRTKGKAKVYSTPERPELMVRRIAVQMMNLGLPPITRCILDGQGACKGWLSKAKRRERRMKVSHKSDPCLAPPYSVPHLDRLLPAYIKTPVLFARFSFEHIKSTSLPSKHLEDPTHFC